MGLRTFFKQLVEIAPQEPVFVRNEEAYRLDRCQIRGGQVGKPQATEWYTQDRLERDGIVGIYRTARTRDFAVVPR
jgi:hypothetical protein